MAPRRILVVESNADSGQALCAQLELWGHDPMLAETGRGAILRSMNNPPEVIVLDLGLADIDGCKVAELIRMEPEGATPLIIAYSGSHAREREAYVSGCDAFLVKPAVEELEYLIEKTRGEMHESVEVAAPALARWR